jgi:pimeloyl-ACP methyl ester carboxylesterase
MAPRGLKHSAGHNRNFGELVCSNFPLPCVVSTAKRRLANAAKGVRRVHLIAHSFGTYVAGDTIATVPSAKFGRAILGGCVLGEDFMDKHYKKWSWPQKGAGTEKYQILSVRNELASRDWIVQVAAQLVRLVPGFGAAGSKGFSGPHELVHSVSTPNGECVACWPSEVSEVSVAEPPSPAVVHNVLCEGLGHSDYFLSANHAILYWIPFFWGYDPAVYRQFLFLCVTTQENFDNGHQTVAEERYKAMRLSSWGQYPAETMDETILEWFGTKFHRIPNNEELDTVALVSLNLIIRGQAAMDDENAPNRDKWIRYLNPSVAIQQAFKRVMKVKV